MKLRTSLLSLVLILLVSFSITAQSTWTPPEHGSTRVGVVGNIWHPVGVFVNHDFGIVGVYATAKSNIERSQVPVMNQFNFTGGISFKIFTNTSRSNASDILVGFSYNTDPDNPVYAKDDYNYGVEVLLLFPFTDRNFRLLGGWSSNSVRWAEGVTLGFGYQF